MMAAARRAGRRGCSTREWDGFNEGSASGTAGHLHPWKRKKRGQPIQRPLARRRVPPLESGASVRKAVRAKVRSDQVEGSFGAFALSRPWTRKLGAIDLCISLQCKLAFTAVPSFLVLDDLLLPKSGLLEVSALLEIPVEEARILSAP